MVQFSMNCYKVAEKSDPFFQKIYLKFWYVEIFIFKDYYIYKIVEAIWIPTNVTNHEIESNYGKKSSQISPFKHADQSKKNAYSAIFSPFLACNCDILIHILLSAWYFFLSS